MKPYALSLCVVLIASAADAAYFSRDIYGTHLAITDNSVIAPDVHMCFENIGIESSAYINNQGTVSGDIFVAGGCDAYIQNSGRIDGEISLGDGAHITQLVRSNADITDINISAPYDIMIYRASDVDWTDVLGVAGAADKIILVDSEVLLLSDMGQSRRGTGAEIELVGHNDFHLMTDEIDFNNPVLSHVTGGGTVLLHTRAPVDSMYALQSFVRDGNLYAKLVRETDYMKILGNDTGRFLNSLRLHNPDDNLLHVLDGAATRSELEHIMRKSMRLNTPRLNRPLLTFNRNLAAASFDLPLFSVPYVILGDKMNSYGLQAGVNLKPGRRSGVSFGAHAACMAFTDGIDDYDGELGGVTTAWHYNGNIAFAAAHAGITFARLGTPEIYYGNSTKRNPNGRAAFFNLDFGPKYKVGAKFSLAPGVGLGAEYARVLKSDADVFARTGILAAYENKTTDLDYTYSVRITSDSLGVLGAAVGVGFTSPDDAGSVRLNAGFVHDEMGRTYNIATSLHFGF